MHLGLVVKTFFMKGSFYVFSTMNESCAGTLVVLYVLNV